MEFEIGQDSRVHNAKDSYPFDAAHPKTISTQIYTIENGGNLSFLHTKKRVKVASKISGVGLFRHTKLVQCGVLLVQEKEEFQEYETLRLNDRFKPNKTSISSNHIRT